MRTLAIRADAEDGLASFRLLYRDFNASFEDGHLGFREGDAFVGGICRSGMEDGEQQVVSGSHAPGLKMAGGSGIESLLPPSCAAGDEEQPHHGQGHHAGPGPDLLPSTPPPLPPPAPIAVRGGSNPCPSVQNMIKRARTLIRRKGKMLHELQEKRATMTHSGLIHITDFEFLKPLSQGGFSHVYLARKIETGALFAIKVMEKAALRAMDMAARVKQERQIMALLGKQCPYVVKLHFAFRSQHHLFFAMDYVPGGDCAGMLEAYGSITEGK